MKADYSKPLNAKRFATTDEAYEKMMKLIGKMIKKDIRGRYYNNSLGPYHFEPTISDEVLDNLRMNLDLKLIKRSLK